MDSPSGVRARVEQVLTEHPVRCLCAAWFVMAAVRAVLALRLPVPQIMTDELLYLRLAGEIANGSVGQRFADSALFPFLGYPAVISPLLRLPGETAYAAIRVVNALLITSACFPLLQIARRYLPIVGALAVAVLSLFLPGNGYSSTVMAENLYLPLTLTLVLTALSAVETSRWWRVLLAGLVAGLLSWTKIQGALTIAMLGVSVLVAPAAALPARSRRVVGVGAAGVVSVLTYGLLNVARLGSGAFSGTTEVWLGKLYAGYAVPGGGAAPVTTLLTSFVVHVVAGASELLPGVGLIAVVAAVSLCFAKRDGRLALLGVLTVAVTVAHALMAARQAVNFDVPTRIHTRYLIQVSPLLLVCGAVVYARAQPRARWVWVPGLLGVAVVAAAGDRFISDYVIDDTPAFSWVRLLDLGSASAATAIVGVAGLAGLGCALLARRHPGWVFATFALAGAAESAGMAQSQGRLARFNAAAFSGLRELPEALVGADKPVAYLVDRRNIHEFWYASFFDHGRGRPYCFDPSLSVCWPAGLDSSARYRDVEAFAAGGYVVVPAGVSLNATEVARGKAYVAYAVGDVVAFARSVEGQYDDQWLGPEATLQWNVESGRDALLTLSLERVPDGLGDRAVTLRGETAVMTKLSPGEVRRLRVAGQGCAPLCSVTVASPGWQPDALFKNGDARRLSVKLTAFEPGGSGPDQPLGTSRGDGL